MKTFLEHLRELHRQAVIAANAAPAMQSASMQALIRMIDDNIHWQEQQAELEARTTYADREMRGRSRAMNNNNTGGRS